MGMIGAGSFKDTPEYQDAQAFSAQNVIGPARQGVEFAAQMATGLPKPNTSEGKNIRRQYIADVEPMQYGYDVTEPKPIQFKLTTAGEALTPQQLDRIKVDWGLSKAEYDALVNTEVAFTNRGHPIIGKINDGVYHPEGRGIAAVSTRLKSDKAYNRSLTELLYHELVHANQYKGGTGAITHFIDQNKPYMTQTLEKDAFSESQRLFREDLADYGKEKYLTFHGRNGPRKLLYQKPEILDVPEQGMKTTTYESPTPDWLDSKSPSNRLLSKIKRASGGKKEDLYLSVYGEDRQKLLENAILRLPKGYRTVETLRNEIQDLYGVYASLDVTDKFLRGISALNEKHFQVNLTHGLSEVHVGKRK
jgi:hypothetical protein